MYYLIKNAASLRINLIVLLVISIAFISSCDSNVLNIEPSDRFSEENVWQDENLIEAYIANTYRNVPSGFVYPLYNLSVITDELNARSNAWSWAVNAGNLTADNLQRANFWSNDAANRNYWTSISRVNRFMENIDRERDVEIEEDVINRMIGEMRVIRAYSYFKLISLYGGVPLITSTFSLGDDFDVARDSYDDVMNFVITELDKAIDELPLGEYDAVNKGRITQGAAMAVKSRALLYAASPLNNPGNDMRKWQMAADAAKGIIDLGQYSLFDNYKSMFLEENIYNAEMIWQRPYNQLDNHEAVYVELSSYPNGYNGFGQIHPLQNLVDDYETVNGLLPEDDPEYDPQDPYVDRDPRFYATILHDGAQFKGREVETFLPGGLDSNEGPVSAWNATETGYYPRKFVNEEITNPSSNNMSQTPWTFFRYAEILLNYAEAMYELGDEDTAREYLNMVRSRPSVDMPDVTESGEALFDRIVNERRIELALEEHRWFDVRRWKIAPSVLNEDQTRMKITKNPDGTKEYEIVFWKEANFNAPRDYLLPIPQDEINKSSALEQNPGY